MLVRNTGAWAFLMAIALLGETGGLSAPVDAAHRGDSKRTTAESGFDFNTYDTDRKGYISFAEFAAHGGERRAFGEADANKDGRLNRDEFIKAIAIDQRIKTGKYFDDAWITAKIKVLFLRDDLLSGLAIDVETQNGVVLLSGEVRTTEQAKRAVGVVSAVGGVRGVKNGLRLK